MASFRRERTESTVCCSCITAVLMLTVTLLAAVTALVAAAPKLTTTSGTRSALPSAELQGDQLLSRLMGVGKVAKGSGKSPAHHLHDCTFER